MRRVYLFIAAIGCGMSGCAPLLTEAMVSAPNRFNPLMGLRGVVPPPESFATDQHFYVPVGPPEASLSVSVIEPKPPYREPKGTVLVVHGIHARGFWMLRTAQDLATAGYRAVLVDLRGHGHSTGDYLSYGPREACDLTQVIDDLERRQLVAGKLGVYGISYGATTSIHLASIDPRVSAVVAVAPFDSMREEVPHYLKTMFPAAGLISDATFQAAIDEAGRRGAYNPDASQASDRIAQSAARILILHGTDDWLVPPQNAQQLQAASGGRASVVLLPYEGHVSIWFDKDHAVADYTRRWFTRHLRAALETTPR